MSTRRDRFRQQIQRWNATTGVEEALREGWVRARPSPGVSEQITAPLELDERMSLALIGGVGSGKTTELLQVAERLRQDPARVVAYVDVGRRVSLAQLKRHVLVGVVALALAEAMRDAGHTFATREAARLESDLLGRWEDPEEGPHYEEPTWIAGLAAPPSENPMRSGLSRVVRSAANHGLTLLVLVDGLDRLHGTEPWLVLRDDIRAVRDAGVGALYVAPASFLLNPAHRDLRALFEQDIVLPYLDPDQPEALAFLVDVLRARALDDVFPASLWPSIATRSGGVLRDLLQIAHLATQNAYGRGLSQVDAASVDDAADRLGRRLLLGVSQEQVELLTTFRRSGRFALTTDASVALVVGGVLVNHEGGRFAIHPCVLPLLDRVAT